MRSTGPIVALFFGAGLVAEVVGSSNIPTIALLNPLVIVFLGLAYGPAALLIREAWVRGRIGWPGALLLGFAYSALNEGVIAFTWFKPDALNFDSRALGRAAGVNWNLVAGLAIFHTFVSMFMSVALVEITFVERAGKPWLGRRAVVLCFLACLLIGAGTLLETQNHARDFVRERAVVLLIIAILVALALRLPRPRFRSTSARAPSRRRAAAAGLLCAVIFFFSFFALTRIASPIAPVAEAALGASIVVVLLRWSGRSDWSRRHTLWLISGALVPAILTSLVRVTALQPLTTILFVLYLCRLARRLAGAAQQPRASAVAPA